METAYEKGTEYVQKAGWWYSHAFRVRYLCHRCDKMHKIRALMFIGRDHILNSGLK
jgi:hypothetical protein